MKLVLTIEPLLENMPRAEIAARVARGLNTTREAANLRLDRAIRGETSSINRNLLAQLFLIADDCRVERGRLVLLETRTIFDLLPHDTTLTYIGGYGSVEADEVHYSETVTTSVWDYRAARRFGRRITGDFSRLRFAPSTTASPKRIGDAVRRELGDLRHNKLSVLSIGSSKSSTMSEWLIAEALDLTPFSDPAPTQPESPFMFHFPMTEEQQATWRGPRERATARFAPDQHDGHSFLMWNGRQYLYVPPGSPANPSDRDGADAPQEPPGRDYAIVLVHALSEAQGSVVLAGLSGAATYGASTLLCAEPSLFELPSASPRYVRVYLVEIAVGVRDRMREPRAGRVLGHWTKGTREFVDTAPTELFELRVH